jgi:uncharacterized repeat protein (TIGR01451 family)/fimbrial isopeptide formation D2 family protein
VPSAVIAGPVDANQQQYTPLIGEEIPLVVTFDNTATNPADIGYSPFVDIVMPKMGDAPPAPENGIEFKSGSASYQGKSLQTTVLTFDSSGNATHPFAKDGSGQPLIVTGTPGDQLVVVELPFGSFAPDQPAASINFTGIVSTLAQPSHSYAVTATGGFRYQLDTSGNPTVDHASLGTLTTDTLQPQLFRLNKTSDAPEHETATGPNFSHTFTVSMAVAPNQTVTDLLLEDTLPAGLQFVQVTDVTANGSSTITPVEDPSTTTPGGRLARQFDQVVGTGSNNDVVMKFTYYVPQTASGSDVIPLGTGGTALVTNSSQASGKWTSANPNFPNEQTVTSSATDPHSEYALTARSVALQKAFTKVGGGTSYQAGDTIKYTLNFQVSDFFALGNAVLSDVLSDGQEFDTSFTPTITYTQQAESFTGQSFDAANYSTTVDPLTGKQTISFQVSDQLRTLRLSADGNLVGAAIPQTGTGGGLPNPTPAGPGTRGTIVFHAKVLDQYRVLPSTGAAVVQGDKMNNTATIEAPLLNYTDLTATGNTVSDGSAKSFTLVSGQVAKSVYAINGVDPATRPEGTQVRAGDEVTYRLQYTLPSSSIDSYTLTDYLPLPIFAAQSLSFAGGGASATAPAAGQWSFGPTDTFSQAPISGPAPTVAANTAANSIIWDFGSFNDSQNRSSKTDILFTVVASNKPFGDGLLLTNQAQQTEKNALGTKISSNSAIVQVTMSEPELAITKGVVSTNNPSGIFNPTQVAPAGVTFSPPGQPGASFTGTVNSNGLASTPIDATLENVVGNDLVKFSIVVENTGSGTNGAFDVAIKDAYDAAKFMIPAGATGLNLQVTDGTGRSLPYTGDLFGTGIELVDGVTNHPGPGITFDWIDQGTSLVGVYSGSIDTTVYPQPYQIPPQSGASAIGQNSGGYNYFDVIANTANGKQGFQTPLNAVGSGNFDFATGNGTATGDYLYAQTLGNLSFLGVPSNYVSSGPLTGTVTFPNKSIATIFHSNINTPAVMFNDGTNTVTFQQAGFIAFDAASNYSSGAFTPGNPPPNNGSGFGSWTVLYPGGGSAGAYIGNTALGSKTFGVASPGNSSAYTGMERAFGAALAIGETFSTTVAATSFSLGTMGLNWKTSSGSELSLFVDSGTGNWKYKIGAAGTPTDTGTAFIAGSPVNVSLERVSGNNVLLSLTQAGSTWSTTLSLSDAAVTSVEFFSAGTQSAGNATNLGFDDLKITADVQQQAAVGPSNPTNGKNIVVVTYDLQLKPTVAPLDVIPNTATLTNYAATEGGPNFLSPAGLKDETTVTIRGPEASKTLIGTSIVDTWNSNIQAVIGELVTYELSVKVPQGTTPAAVLTDNFTEALQFVRVVGTPTVDPGVTVANLGTLGNPTLSQNGYGQNIATWQLGDIVNSNTDDQLHGFTFRIEAVVLNDSLVPQSIFAPVNRAELAWTGHTLPEVAAAMVQVIEPKLTLNKTVSPTTAQAGDTATFTIVVSGSHTTAYDISLSDFFPTGVTYVPGTLVHTAGVAPTTLTTSGGGAAFAATWAKLTPSETSTLTFQATVNANVTSGQAITNQATTEWTSLPGNPGQITRNSMNAYERTGSGSTTLGELNNYKTSDSATVTASKPTVAKSLVATQIENSVNTRTQAVIGETATYAITVTVPQGRTPAAELIDRMAPGLAFVRYVGGFNNDPAVLTVPGLNNAPVITSAGRLATWNLGDIVNTDTNNTTTETFQLLVEAVVLNVNSNHSGVRLNNRAQLKWNNQTASSNQARNRDVIVIEPKLKTTKTATVGGLGGNPGDPVTYTIMIEQDPTSQTDAFSVELNDILPSEIASPVLTSVVDTEGVVTASNFQLSGSALSTRVPFNFEKNPSNRTITLIVEGTLQGPFTAGQQITNTDFVRWASLGIPLQITPYNPNAWERTGSGLTSKGQLNNYVASSTAAFTVNTADLAVTKTVSNASPNVGDTITFTVTVTNNGPDTATDVELTDTFPVAGLQIVGTPTVSQGTYDVATGVWDIGTVLPGAGNAQTLTIQAEVLAPASGIPLAQTNSAEITHVAEPDPNPANNRDDVTETPKYADLGVKKTTSNSTPNVGETVTYTVKLFNLGKDAATGVKLTDSFPANVTYVTHSTSSGTFDPTTGIWDVGTVPLTATVSNPLTLTIDVTADTASTGFNIVSDVRTIVSNGHGEGDQVTNIGFFITDRLGHEEVGLTGDDRCRSLVVGQVRIVLIRRRRRTDLSLIGKAA